MPKLNTEQLMERIQKRIHQLELGEEIAAKDIKALLNAEQQQQLVDALAAQVELKKIQRARTDEEKQALGWKSIREVRLDVLRAALNAANDGLLADYERRLKKKKFAKPTSTCVNIRKRGKQTRAVLLRKVQPTMHSHVQHYLALMDKT